MRHTKLPIVNQAFDGGKKLEKIKFLGPRLCMKCSMIKPDRAHHCSICGNCIL